MATTLQRQTIKRSDAPKFLCVPILFLFLSLQFVTKLLQKPRIFLFVLQFQEESRTVNYETRHKKGRRGLKGPQRPTEPSD